MKVLFVCTGNICRSPLAEGIFRHKVEQAQLSSFFFIDSAATHAYHVGSPPDERSQQVATLNSINIEQQSARQLLAKDLTYFDRIMVMDSANMQAISDAFPTHDLSHVQKLSAISPQLKGRDIQDPYFDDFNGFEKAFYNIDIACNDLLSLCVEEHKSARV